MDLVDVFLHIMEAHHLTKRVVWQTLGYSSANQLTRILERKVSQNILTDFGSRLLACAQKLHLTEAEQQEVKCSMACDGGTELLAARCLLDVMSGRINSAPAPEAFLLSEPGGLPQTFAKRYAGAESVQLSVLGCESIPLFACFSGWAKQVPLTVNYYCLRGDNLLKVARGLAMTTAFFREPWLNAFRVEHPGTGPYMGLLRADAIWLEVREGGRICRCEMLIPQEDGHMAVLPMPALDDVRSRVIFPADAVIKPLMIPGDQKGDYLTFLRYCAKMERNRSMFQIRNDISVDLIPVEIQLAVLMPETAERLSKEMLDEMVSIQHQRYVNSMSRRQAQYRLYDFKAMQAFARTGKTHDHFWGFQPYTPEQRRKIIGGLIRLAEENKHAHVQFLHEDVSEIGLELAWYNGHGIVMILPDNYRLGGGYSELLTQNELLVPFFSGFFRRYMTKQCAYSEKESLAMLRALLDETA